MLPLWLWVYTLVIYARSEESVLSSRPCFETMYLCMHEYNIIGWFVDTIQLPCCPGAYTLFGREGNAKENEKLNTASSSEQNYFLEYLGFFFKEPVDKKKQKIGGKIGEATTTYRCTWYTYHIKDALDNHEQTGGGAGCKKPRTTRDRCVVHICASSVLSQRATSPAPAQRKNCRYFSASST